MDLPTGFAEAFASLEAAQKVIGNIGRVAAQAYFTNKFRARPIVDHHFTAGNGGRYGWPDLSPAYAKAKSRGTVGIGRGNGVFLGRSASALTPASARQAGQQLARSGERRASKLEIGAGSTLPMLVRSGKMREAINTGGKIVRVSADQLRIVWEVAAYVAWHHTGGSKPGRPPKRSPIEPNEADVTEVREVVEQYVQQSIGNGRAQFTPTT